MSRILALDVGEKRIGVAVSDELHILARPLKTLAHSSLAGDVSALAVLLAEYAVETLVVGFPCSLSGEEGPQALRVKRYARKLAAALPVPVVLWDERYSTIQAVQRLAEAGRRRRDARGDKGQVDAAAAAIILQGYLDTQRET
ncbi:MAG: Holliday junction resolvase RuvX [Thermoflexales bacterium]|nr:Holliday junction resolvase RuvX [Thermoflexales bacterium]